MTRGTNSPLMRQKNEKAILSLINKEPLSRADIAKKTGLTKAAVTIICEELIKRGIIYEKKSSISSVGRTPYHLYLNGDSMYFMGIDISRSNITVGICDLCGSILSEECFSVCAPDESLKRIKKSIEFQLEKNNIEKEKIYKAGISAPGPVLSEEGRILNPPNFSLWHNFPIAEKLSEITDVEIVFDNISKAAAVCEKYFGTASEFENFVCIVVDEGIGAGVFKNNTLLNIPCELGHITIEHNGILCECGNRGCLEKYASVPAILKTFNLNNWKDAGIDAIKQEAEYLSSAIITASNIFAADNVVLSGSIIENSGELINMLSANLSRSLFNKKVKITEGKIKSRTLMAAAMAINEFFKGL